MESYFLVGEVLEPQGIRGEAKVRPYASNPDDYFRWSTMYLEKDGQYRPIGVKCSRVHDGFAYMTLEGCTGPEDVEKYRGAQLYVAREDAAPLEEGEVYIRDLIGCRAVDEEGREIGVVTDVLQYGSVDTYVFKTPRGTMMAPALLAVFPVTDVEQRVLHVCAERLAEVAVYED